MPVYFSDRRPQLGASSDEVWVYSDQTALISCTELVEKRRAGPSQDKPNTPSIMTSIMLHSREVGW